LQSGHFHSFSFSSNSQLWYPQNDRSEVMVQIYLV
jgi:hypothetical protein